MHSKREAIPVWPRLWSVVSPTSPVNWLLILENICKFLPMKLSRWLSGNIVIMRIIVQLKLFCTEWGKNNTQFPRVVLICCFIFSWLFHTRLLSWRVRGEILDEATFPACLLSDCCLPTSEGICFQLANPADTDSDMLLQSSDRHW